MLIAMVDAAFHNDYLKERTWIEIREEPPKSAMGLGDDFSGWGQKGGNYVAI